MCIYINTEYLPQHSYQFADVIFGITQKPLLNVLFRACSLIIKRITRSVVEINTKDVTFYIFGINFNNDCASGYSFYKNHFTLHYQTWLR